MRAHCVITSLCAALSRRNRLHGKILLCGSSSDTCRTIENIIDEATLFVKFFPYNKKRSLYKVSLADEVRKVLTEGKVLEFER